MNWSYVCIGAWVLLVILVVDETIIYLRPKRWPKKTIKGVD